MSDLKNQLANLTAEEEAKNRKKTTAELSLEFDEEIDKLFLEDSTIKLQDRIIHLREVAKTKGLNIKESEIKRKIWEGRRRAQGQPEMLKPGMGIDAPNEKWALENIFMYADSNMLVSLPKVGKTTLFVDLISKWHFGCEENLGQKLIGECPPVLIVGIDMTRSRWMPLLGRFGLAYWDDEKKQWFLLEDGPIKGMFTQNEPIHLDDEGLSIISEIVAKEKGYFCLFDSYHKLIKPFGLSEGDANFDGPLCDLLEVLAPHEVTSVTIHHSGHGRKGEGAVAACRGSTALPAAVSQVINMKWLRREQDQKDKRVVLETEGRGEELSMIVLQEKERWSVVGDISEVLEEQRLIDDENKLNDTQYEALTVVRKRSPAPTTANDLKNELEISRRQALKTLEQLTRKQLIERIGKDKDGAVNFNTKTSEGPHKPRSPESPESQPEGPSGPLGHGVREAPLVLQLPTRDVKDAKDPKDHQDQIEIKITNSKVEKICLNCSLPFLASRKDKKFCSDRCRVRCHHAKKAVCVTK